jgi:DNA-binding transcriptional regulator PaaX
MKDNYKQIYLFILSELKTTGNVPTLQAIGTKFGFSRENARQKLTRMAKKGYIVPIKAYKGKYYPQINPEILETIKVV